MNYTDTLIQRVKNSSRIIGISIVEEGGLYRLPFPVPEPYAVLMSGRENREFLLGNDAPVTEEKLVIKVICSETDGAQVCVEAAKELCTALVTLDEEKRVTGFSVSGCSFNNDLVCYETGITVGLREYSVSGGDDNRDQ